MRKLTDDERADPAVAEEMFRVFWPQRALWRPVCELLERSVRLAHECGESSWSVTMHPDMIRLNVGQVEVLTLHADVVRLLFADPFVVSDAELEVVRGEEPFFYKSVPVPSGICVVPISLLLSTPAGLRSAHERYVCEAASRKRSSPFKSSFSPAVLTFAESVLGTTLPRPSYFGQPDE